MRARLDSESCTDGSAVESVEFGAERTQRLTQLVQLGRRAHDSQVETTLTDHRDSLVQLLLHLSKVCENPVGTSVALAAVHGVALDGEAVVEALAAGTCASLGVLIE